MKFLLFSIIILMGGCALKTGDLKNISVNDVDILKSGDEIGTTTTIENDLQLQDNEGARILTREEKKRADKAFNEGLDLVKNTDLDLRSMLMNRHSPTGEAGLRYVAAGPKDWKGWKDEDITLAEYLKQYPKAKEATADMQFLLWQMFKVHPTFVLTECARSKARQKKLVKKGRSWTNNSKHNRNPAQACDIVTKRRGKKDFKDIDALGMYQGIAVGLGQILSTMPCEVFGSIVTRVIDWFTVRDLFHIEAVPRKECKNKVVLEYIFWYVPHKGGFMGKKRRFVSIIDWIDLETERLLNKKRFTRKDYLAVRRYSRKHNFMKENLMLENPMLDDLKWKQA